MFFVVVRKESKFIHNEAQKKIFIVQNSIFFYPLIYCFNNEKVIIDVLNSLTQYTIYIRIAHKEYNFRGKM